MTKNIKVKVSNRLVTVTVSRLGDIVYRGRCLAHSDNGTGYKTVSIHRKRFYVHRLVAVAFCPNPNGYTEVNHKDLDKSRNVDTNLEWCSRKENQVHASKNKVFSGYTNILRRKKLTGDSVDRIRSDFASGVFTITALAIRFGVSRAIVSKIIHNKVWVR